MLVSNRAFSLIELIVAVSILLIMLTIGMPYLSKYVRKYGIKQETSQIFSDLVAQRYKSITTGYNYGVMFNTNSYILFKFKDTNYNLIFNGAQEMIDTVVKNVKYKILKKTGNGYVGASNDVVIFDKNGVARNRNWGFGSFTVKVNSPGISSIRYNCVVISAERIKEAKCQ